MCGCNENCWIGCPCDCHKAENAPPEYRRITYAQLATAFREVVRRTGTPYGSPVWPDGPPEQEKKP